MGSARRHIPTMNILHTIEVAVNLDSKTTTDHAVVPHLLKFKNGVELDRWPPMVMHVPRLEQGSSGLHVHKCI